MKIIALNNARNFFGIAIHIAIFCLVFFVLPYSVSAAQYYRSPEVKLFSESSQGFTNMHSFYAYDSLFTGGGTVAVADLGTDGVNEIVTAAGLGGSPHIRTFDLAGNFLTQFYAYDENMRAGVNVTAGDIDGDGRAEIITAPKSGGGPHVRVFNSYGMVKSTVGYYAYDVEYHGGVNIAAGDVDGDGIDEIVTGTGIDTASHVRVFDGTGTPKDLDFYPFAAEMQGGVSVAVGNVDGGLESEIITAVQNNGEAWVKVYKYNSERTILGEWKAFDNGFSGGINVTAGDVDGDGLDEVIVAVNGHGGPQVLMFKAHGDQLNPGFFAYEEDFHGGVAVAVGDIDNSGRESVVVLPGKMKPDGRTDVAKYVRVDLSEQRMYAYEQGYLVNSFLVSTGLSRTPTPPGEYHIQRKLYSHLYSGPGYYLPNTLYNLQFRSGYYLHGAYWHNNFGHPMSHGCVNISYHDAAWLFDWMQVGDLTVIEY
ncbi:MAG: L,D-transpeptidase family protein [bacterium]|nr:L,D-transpeptidase family protein [bacterium]